MFMQWRLMTEVNSDPGSVLQVVLDLCHVTSDVTPTWCDYDQHETTTRLSIEVASKNNYIELNSILTTMMIMMMMTLFDSRVEAGHAEQNHKVKTVKRSLGKTIIVRMR